MPYQGQKDNRGDPMEYPPEQRDAYSVSYATNLICPTDGPANENGAYWEPADWCFCCCSCGRTLKG